MHIAITPSAHGSGIQAVWDSNSEGTELHFNCLVKSPPVRREEAFRPFSHRNMMNAAHEIVDISTPPQKKNKVSIFG